MKAVAMAVEETAAGRAAEKVAAAKVEAPAAGRAEAAAVEVTVEEEVTAADQSTL